MNTPKLSLVLGLPGAGKTSFVRSLFNATRGKTQLICFDSLRRAYGHEYCHALEPMVYATAGLFARMAFIEGRDVLIDESITLFEQAAQLAECAEHFGAKIHMFILDRASPQGDSMAQIVYASRDVTIYQGDALKTLATLPDASADAVITDPPYCSGGVTLSARQADPAQKYQQSGTKKTYPPMLGEGKDQRSFLAWAWLWMSECWRIAKDGAPMLVFTDWRQLPVVSDAIQAAGWYWQGVVCWNKRSSRPQRGRFRNQCEYVLFASKGRFTPFSKACLPGVYDYPILDRQKVHLTGKPVPLIKDLLAVTPDGCTVLDPFMGGGTTALAALETGRKCRGVELSREYAALSAERIKTAEEKKHQK